MKLTATRSVIYGVAIALSLVACSPLISPPIIETHVCPIADGRYPVQTVSYDTGTGSYHIMALQLPACAKQPLILNELKLARINDHEQEKALLVQSTQDGPTLFLHTNYQIQLFTNLASSDAAERDESQSSSSWTPFLAGAAGAAIGGMVMNSLFKQPRYYTPPPVQPGQKSVQGYGSSGATKKEAVASHNRKYPNNLINVSSTKSKFLNRSPNKRPSSTFFKKKADGLFKSRLGRRRT